MKSLKKHRLKMLIWETGNRIPESGKIEIGKGESETGIWRLE
jgi:hypothetical protein